MGKDFNNSVFRGLKNWSVKGENGSLDIWLLLVDIWITRT